MNDDLLPLLKVHAYFHGASDDTLRTVLQRARVTNHQTGSVVHEAHVPVTTVNFVIRGRLKAVRVDDRGGESPFRMIERGDQFGMMIGALAEPVPVRVVALEPTTVLGLDYEEAMELTLTHPDLRRRWLRTFAGQLREQFFGATPRRSTTLLALIHETPATRRTAERLVGRLHAVGEKLAVFSDAEGWGGPADVPFRPMRQDGRELDFGEVRQQAAEWQDADRIIFDVTAEMPPEWAARMLGAVDRAIYFAPVAAGAAAVHRLQALDVPARGWRDKISVAWLLEDDSPVAHAIPNLRDFAARDFKIADKPPQLPWGRSVDAGLERLVHELRGVRIGVALGGGAALGMAHLGVLRAFEQCGIVPDMLAGTSAGAMTGIVYASGLDPAYSTEQFATDLRPGWFFRHLGGGNAWYLLYKYRTGQFDPMLRKYLHDWKLEQLPVPCLSVTTDLVSGNYVVRDRGDAVHAICESINVPGLSVPICRNGQALVDGGLINNVPADVLVSRGCNFVIAASVTSKIAKKFCDITPDGPMPRRTKPGFVSTILRSFSVQHYCMNSVGVQPADVVIAPDVSGFEATEFMRARELAAIGQAAALEQITTIRQLLTRLDPQLFRAASETAPTQNL